MPRYFHVRTAVSLAGVLGTLACEHRDVSSLSLLTAPRWHLSDCVFCPDDSPLPDRYSPPADQELCVRDDFTVFQADGTYVDDEGALQCDPRFPQARRFTWRFLSEGRELALCYAAPGQTEEIERHYKIILLTPRTLVLEGWAPAYHCRYRLTYTAFSAANNSFSKTVV
jgi:hypothetical protein